MTSEDANAKRISVPRTWSSRAYWGSDIHYFLGSIACTTSSVLSVLRSLCTCFLAWCVHVARIDKASPSTLR